jgi:hypothetical protein
MMKIKNTYGKEVFRINPFPHKRKRQGKTFQEQLEDSLNAKKKAVEKQIKKSILDILV